MKRAKNKPVLGPCLMTKVHTFLKGDPPIIVITHPKKGEIVIAKRNISKGDIVFCWPGSVTTGLGVRLQNVTFEVPYPRPPFFTQAPAKENTEPLKCSYFTEDSEGPNGTFSIGLFFKATTDIEPGRQVFYDFKMSGPERIVTEVVTVSNYLKLCLLFTAIYPHTLILSSATE
ncbi:SET [Symphysodon discus adomavirus 1]|uniref:SET n=1 Tax=Symphysodon discus adomavirus 1 TaxID=2175118 RepID=A0A2S1MK34_9VIRU|nr:SET [Symphysodon discus adomavirus 1]AWG87403.1 SET [Symphysodon discus adomavirus 1]